MGVLRNIFVVKMEKVTWDWRKVHNAQLLGSYCSTKYDLSDKSRRMRWACGTKRKRARAHTHTHTRTHKRTHAHARAHTHTHTHTHGWEDNIKIDLTVPVPFHTNHKSEGNKFSITHIFWHIYLVYLGGDCHCFFCVVRFAHSTLRNACTGSMLLHYFYAFICQLLNFGTFTMTQSNESSNNCLMYMEPTHSDMHIWASSSWSQRTLRV